MCKNAVNKINFCNKICSWPTQQNCDKTVLENDAALDSIPDWYKTQEMCDEPVDNYPHA